MSTGLPVVIYIGIFLLLPIIIIMILKRKVSKAKATSITAKTLSKSNTIHSSAKTIFINYRREDSSGYSLALYNELTKWYNKNDIFKDFHNINGGEDFEESIEKALNSCSVLLVIISDRWIDILHGRQSKKAQEEQKDFVNLEISTALIKNIYTIPVTFNGARMPKESELPDELKSLTRRQSIDIDQARFETDTMKLVQTIDKQLGVKRK